jgi:uncharacterized protein (TIGR00255 family)
MTVSSMTGFARTQDHWGPWRCAWEIKTVNSKGLDLRLRTPPNFDALEIKARALIAERLTRGTCFANLAAKRDDAAGITRINRPALERILQAVEDLPLHGLRPASLDGLLALRGVVEVVEPEDSEAQRNALEKKILAMLSQTLDALVASRNGEGLALAKILGARLDRIAELSAQAEQSPARTPDAIRARLAQHVAALLESANGLDPLRLYQEAVMLAVKADIREELDRLAAHVASARASLSAGGPIGRRLDFLAQEMSRETNTLCAKSNDPALSALGLELKIEVEQWREQVQNVE